MKSSCRSSSFLACYKTSRYNIVAHGSRGPILYNSLTGARLSLTPQTLAPAQLDCLEAGDWPAEVPLPADAVTDLLLAQGFFVDRDIDELNEFIHVQDSVRVEETFRRITVILTRRCNLGCQYCYQDKTLGDAEADEARVRTYLHSQIVPGGRLQLTWFGGEPLLRFGTICSLSDAIIPACDAVGTHYSAGMSTNGVLLDEDRIDQLLSRRVTHFQVSLDGPERVQEIRRPSLIKQQSTYGRIVANLERLARAGASIVIKVILDVENAESVPELFADLGRRGLLGSGRVRVAIQHTEAKFAAAGYDKRFPSLEAFAAAKMRLLSCLVKNGYPLEAPSRKPEFCAATSPYATQIDMAGNFFRCSTERENLTGVLAESGDAQRFTNPAYEAMFTRRRFAHRLCDDCKVLPICGGGCTIAAEKLAERDICSFYRVAIKDVLRLLESCENGAFS